MPTLIQRLFSRRGITGQGNQATQHAGEVRPNPILEAQEFAQQRQALLLRPRQGSPLRRERHRPESFSDGSDGEEGKKENRSSYSNGGDIRRA